MENLAVSQSWVMSSLCSVSMKLQKVDYILSPPAFLSFCFLKILAKMAIGMIHTTGYDSGDSDSPVQVLRGRRKIDIYK